MTPHEKLYVLACRAIAEQMRLTAHAMMRAGLSVEATIKLLHERLDPDFGEFEGMAELFSEMEKFQRIPAPETELRMHFHEQLRSMAVELERDANEAEGKK